jgi:uncharacterized protein YecE (DUF72 family)
MNEQTDLFQGEHAALERAWVGPADVPPELRRVARGLSATQRFGTSSWSFPGWTGIVYDRKAPKAHLARKGLQAYGKHPLLRSVGLDRSYYGPLDVDTYREYGDAVSDDFRFLVKADRVLTFPHLTSSRSGGQPPGIAAANPLFLDPTHAVRTVIEPAMEGLGAKLQVILFQFPPFPEADVGGPGAFAGRLRHFLAHLPIGPAYGVEVRTPSLLSPAYRSALEAHGAVHCYTVHPTMPSIEAQRRAIPIDDQPLVVARWMLGHGLGYEVARDLYQPFDRLVREDARSRRQLCELCVAGARGGKDTMTIVNNKAEGSSPLSVFKLARAVSAAMAESAH